MLYLKQELLYTHSLAVVMLGILVLSLGIYQNNKMLAV